MEDMRAEGPVMITTTPYQLVSHDKAVVDLETGCAWIQLAQGNRTIGIAFAGPSRFAVDAIAETEMGALGKSVTTTLDGVQLYLGETTIEAVSREAKDSDVGTLGFNGTTGFSDAVTIAIKDKVNGQGRTHLAESNGRVLLGNDAHSKSIVLVIEKTHLVFVYDENVFSVGEKETIHVDESGVRIGRKKGKALVICQDGIHGLEGLDHVGSVVEAAVSGALSGLSAIRPWKSLMAIRCLPYAWDDVDEFDWDDD
ncbi:MAG: hypothetical protein JSW05_04965 [Candidatus Thorarchaeota archaeon]|nr:MAG: hypothetical protein JSW05_04965 [Candidatus Thorarchaeota archaeon]